MTNHLGLPRTKEASKMWDFLFLNQENLGQTERVGYFSNLQYLEQSSAHACEMNMVLAVEIFEAFPIISPLSLSTQLSWVFPPLGFHNTLQGTLY